MSEKCDHRSHDPVEERDVQKMLCLLDDDRIIEKLQKRIFPVKSKSPTLNAEDKNV